MDRIFQELNKAHKTIKITRENPDETGLPFLDCKVLCTSESITTSWYRKPTCKNILLHANSAHPSFMKYKVVKNLEKRAMINSTTEIQKQLAQKELTKIVKENGYVGTKLQKPISFGGFKKGGTILKIPYVSDNFSREITHAVKKSGLPFSVVFCPPPNLKRIFTKSRFYDQKCTRKECLICPNNNDGDCKRKGAIYCLKCEECGAEYIGETGRECMTRFQEHLRGLKNPSDPNYTDYPLAIHRTSRHSGIMPSVSINILAFEPNITRRKIKEAILIRQHQPILNNKLEMTQILSLLMPLN